MVLVTLDFRDQPYELCLLSRPVARILCVGGTAYKWRGTMQMKGTLP